MTIAHVTTCRKIEIASHYNTIWLIFLGTHEFNCDCDSLHLSTLLHETFTGVFLCWGLPTLVEEYFQSLLLVQFYIIGLVLYSTLYRRQVEQSGIQL